MVTSTCLAIPCHGITGCASRGRGGRGRGGQYGGNSTSPGEQAAVEKAAAKYKQHKSSMSKREQAKELLDVLIPQTVEMNIQQMLANKQLKKKDVKAKRKEMLKLQMRAAEKQISKGKPRKKKKKKKKKRKKKSSRYYSCTRQVTRTLILSPSATRRRATALSRTAKPSVNKLSARLKLKANSRRVTTRWNKSLLQKRRQRYWSTKRSGPMCQATKIQFNYRLRPPQPAVHLCRRSWHSAVYHLVRRAHSVNVPCLRQGLYLTFKVYSRKACCARTLSGRKRNHELCAFHCDGRLDEQENDEPPRDATRGAARLHERADRAAERLGDQGHPDDPACRRPRRRSLQAVVSVPRVDQSPWPGS